ncbi:MAG: FeoA family protein [Desulfobacca sp.]|uniref:FeoA family protein n=1 Tax=Desulfobacca sp. TaxID=2067990 RepID=UPI004048FD09
MSNQASIPRQQAAIQNLGDLAPGQDAVITGFLGGRRLQGRLLAMGLFPGQRLTVCQNNGASLIISLNGGKIVLGRGVGQKVLTIPTGPCCRREQDCCCPWQAGGGSAGAE